MMLSGSALIALWHHLMRSVAEVNQKPAIELRLPWESPAKKCEECGWSVGRSLIPGELDFDNGRRTKARGSRGRPGRSVQVSPVCGLERPTGD
jgi:hypothetical protein